MCKWAESDKDSKKQSGVVSEVRLTVAGRAGRLQATAADLLSAQTNLLFELLDLRVAVAILFCLLRPLCHHLTFHQLNGSNQRF